MTTLCGYDGSPYAIEALEVAATFARKRGDRLVVAQVLDVLGADEPAVLGRAQDELRAEVARHTSPDDAEVRVISGEAVAALAHLADDRRAGLVVIGARALARHDLSDWLESTALRLTSRLHHPVLIVRRRGPLLDAIAGRAPLRVTLAVAPGRGARAVAWLEALSAHLLLTVDAVHVAAPHEEVDEVALAETAGPHRVRVVRDERSLGCAIAEIAARDDAGLVVIGREKPPVLHRTKARAIVADCTTNVACVPEDAP
ncbi:MAG: universal stress protein [Deltaproteobacteria bacterium]|nr:universal stress protein [Deltaproteobacteria bacterium]